MRILLIEDDKATADYIAKGLQEIGHVVQVARTGRDGMLLAAGEAWDVIVTDRMLPGRMGSLFCARCGLPALPRLFWC